MGIQGSLKTLRLLWAATLCSIPCHVPRVSAQASQALSISTREIQEFAELLRHLQSYPDLIQILEADQKKLIEEFKKFGATTLRDLPPEVFKNLQQRFFAKFIGFKETKEKLEKQIELLKERKIALPLGEKKSIVELDLKIKATQDQVKQARYVLFFTSFDANKALLEALKSPRVKDIAQANQAAEEKAKIEAAKPKLPGTPQESKQERMNTAEADKLNLTPVDPEFYNTQLGKKLEKDLGGRAEYWNYDFDQDELYVVVGNEAGKIRVKQKDQSTRIIQTRVGSSFDDFPSNYEGDEAVDTNLAKGRFLTGNPADPTLFGEFPTAKEDPGLPEGKLPTQHKHKKGDGHNH